MCEHCRPGEPLPSISEINAERERVSRADQHVAEIFAVDHAHGANGYELHIGVGVSSEPAYSLGALDYQRASEACAAYTRNWTIPQNGTVAIKYLKRVCLTVHSHLWDWNEETRQSARALFSELINALLLETACERCDESLADCECKTCGSCDKKFDAGNVCERCETCSDCCTCLYCEGCEKKTDESTWCGDCERCESCCDCISCGHCGEHVDNTCSECDRCESCCDCNEFNGGDSTTAPRLTQNETFHNPTRKQLTRSTLKRVIGMELELSSVTKDEDALKEWARKRHAGLVEDGSLSHEKQGVEVVTSPSAGDIFLDDCASLGETLKKCGAEITDECGLHVHVDARDFHTADLRRLVIMYSAVERAMFELVSRTRMGNHYCQACGFKYLSMLEGDGRAHKEFRRSLHTLLYKPKDKDMPQGKDLGSLLKSEKTTKYHPSRYYALNLHTYFYRKTVEFRLHEAHLNPEVFTNWSLFCGWIVEKAYTLSERQILELLVKHERGNGESLLREILPEDPARWIIDRLQTRRKAREEGESVESTYERLKEYTVPKDALRASIWHTANAPAPSFSYRTESNPIQTEMPLCAE